jgi:hypothetical protein
LIVAARFMTNATEDAKEYWTGKRERRAKSMVATVTLLPV